ncbi:GNAT family N-acetyltransferase [Kitasatospora sp. A2-31]|uniref:GNAT family N-acetyltransferase n=1 Tax=Kitasatospora sp. A2-31 TaxID=2916414 RepID=UPI001EEB263A|nr:GNAT family N-acetyltransferase [Kitasatospora sp. A2-31]MCG6498147.1 GNAT family N-acetyltransferase [Kitasatospora sp. A2-31]
MVTLQVLTTDDWPLWRALRLAALADAPHAFKVRSADWDRGEEQRWRARLELPGAYHLAAQVGGRGVGMVSGLPGTADGSGRTGRTAELRSLWVSPEVRGRRVGDRLITAVEDWARTSRAELLKLAVLPGNEPALALYRRHGFVASAEPGALLPGGAGRELVMVKALAASKCS